MVLTNMFQLIIFIGRQEVSVAVFQMHVLTATISTLAEMLDLDKRIL